jgi:glycosyltransferase involved in cell wall biosynthesis
LFLRQKTPELFRSGDEKAFEQLLDREAMQLISNREFLSSLQGTDRNRRIFEVSSYLANRMLYLYTLKMAKMPFRNGFLSMMNDLSSIALVHLLVSPYYMAFNHMHRDKGLMQALDESFKVSNNREKKEKIALFTDTLDDINGVAITIRRLVKTARERGIDLTVITSDDKETGYRDGVMHFKSLGQISLPEYPELQLNFPPILNILDYVEREGFNRIHVSTPGTIGSLGLAIGKLFRLPVDGTYHTDIPHYVRDLTDDDFLEKAAWNFMIWFYGQMNEVMVPSASTRDQLIAHGLDSEKTRPLPRWVDCEHFHPELRNRNILAEIGLSPDVFTFIYVGRVSREKNLALLVDAFTRVVSDQKSQLVVVGDGPYRQEMEQKLSGLAVAFTGFKDLDELPDFYAACDMFLFPSTTDTFGNVVLEAQSSGLPVIVTDQGGPQELMINGETGHVIPGDDPEALTASMLSALNDQDKIRNMGWAAREFILEGSRTRGLAYTTILRQEEKVSNF